MTNLSIVKMPPCIIEENSRIVEGAIIVETVKDAKEAAVLARKYISEHSKEKDSTLTTFWGSWHGERILFLCNDMGMALKLKPNKPATLAYLGQCLPGTMHIILGPAVGLINKELW